MLCYSASQGGTDSGPIKAWTQVTFSYSFGELPLRITFSRALNERDTFGDVVFEMGGRRHSVADERISKLRLTSAAISFVQALSPDGSRFVLVIPYASVDDAVGEPLHRQLEIYVDSMMSHEIAMREYIK